MRNFNRSYTPRSYRFQRYFAQRPDALFWIVCIAALILVALLP